MSGSAAEPTEDGTGGTSELLYDVADGVATLTINRPQRRNALSWDVIEGLRTHVARARTDPDVRVLVLTGAGDRAFCAGADLTGMRADAGYAEIHEARGELARLFDDLWSLGKPTIARVRGYCLAGGIERHSGTVIMYGHSPTSISGVPNVASSAATTRSQLSASPKPPARQ
jgi:enoyl-CoA hydratase/carnithine racemase